MFTLLNTYQNQGFTKPGTVLSGRKHAARRNGAFIAETENGANDTSFGGKCYFLVTIL